MPRAPDAQQSLFAPAPRPTPLPPVEPPDYDFSAAARLPPEVRFGTSSWVYPGWKGLIYRDHYGSEAAFRRDSLAEYGRWPWFRAVGLDASFYGPMKPSTLDRMAGQLPLGTVWVSKVWERLTIPRFPQHPRYGDEAGRANPDFLSIEVLRREVLAPFDRPGVRERCGAFLFEFPALAPPELEALPPLLDRLDRFFAALPPGFRYAVELRTPELVQPAWYALLRRHGVSPCFNSWERMPALRVQWAAAEAGGGLGDGLRLLRLLTPRGLSYEASVARFAPFDRLQEPDADVREDAIAIALDALRVGAPTIVLVNNRLEGNSPATIDALGRALLARLDASTSARL